MRVERTGDDSPRRGRAPRVGGERWLDLVFRQMPGAVWATNRRLEISWVLGRVLGDPTKPDDVIGLSVYDYVGTHDDNDAAVRGHKCALAGESARFRYQREQRCYEVTIEPLWSDHEVIGCVGAAVDVTARQEAEQRLERSEARLREAQDLAHVGTWQWDVAGDRVQWSDEMHRIYGVAPGTFSGEYEAFIERVQREDRGLVERAILGALRRQSNFDFSHRIVRPDGEVRTLHCRGAVLTEHGHATTLVGSCWDVTEQVNAQAALEESVSLLRATLNSTADGVLVIDREGNVAAANDRFLELWHLPRRLLETKDDKRLLAAVLEQLEDPEAFQARVRALYASPREESLDELRFRDGRVFERYSQPQRVGEEIIGRVWSFRDVTERSRLLARATFLSDASRLLATLDVESALGSMARLVVETLAEACAVDLYEPGGPRRLVSVCHGEEPPELAVASAALPTRPQVYSGTGRAWMSVPVTSRSTLFAALRIVAHVERAFLPADVDVAVELAARIALALENARVHQEACEALRARDEVLAVAAHEIRGPLTSMRLAIHTLRARADGKADNQAFELLERENRRLSRFVDELLDAVRVRGGMLTLQLEEVDLQQVIHDVVERMASEVERSGSSLGVVMDGPVMGVWDKDRLDQAIGNLLSNAVKYGLGKPIRIEVKPDDDHVEISVIDQGMGVADDKREHLFEPFSRAVSPRHYGGLGLGLYIVRTVIDSLGGSVSFESEIGRGSRFTLRLPRRQGGE